MWFTAVRMCSVGFVIDVLILITLLTTLIKALHEMYRIKKELSKG